MLTFSFFLLVQIAANGMDKASFPDLSKTTPAAKIGPHPSWFDPEKVRKCRSCKLIALENLQLILLCCAS